MKQQLSGMGRNVLIVSIKKETVLNGHGIHLFQKRMAWRGLGGNHCSGSIGCFQVTFKGTWECVSANNKK